MKIAKLLFYLDGNLIKKIAFGKGSASQITIGNGKSSQPVEMVLQSQYISRRHATISSDGNRLYVKDLGSTNGTFINNKPIPAQQDIPLSIGDVITFSTHATSQVIVAEADTVAQSSQPQPQSNKQYAGSGASTLVNKLKQSGSVTIGRRADCDLVFSHSSVSRLHATIEKMGENQYRITDKSRNGTYVNGSLIAGSAIISGNDTIRIGQHNFQLASHISGQDVKADMERGYVLNDYLKKKSRIIIGRSADKADITLPNRQVSRAHAEISKEGDSYFVKDLGSANGTFLNGRPIHGKTKFTANDSIGIGLYEFKLNEESVNFASEYAAIRAVNIRKNYNTGSTQNDRTKDAVKEMSITIPHKAFVAMMGPSGCGKTTLMNMLNNANPATTGRILYFGNDLRENFNMLKRQIGYVPQDDIVHKQLTVDQSLRYAAKLKMPDNTPQSEVNEKIDEVLSDLNIDKSLRDKTVGSLSGGQRKRISIAVELLTDPAVLFLDEPTSPLDPETIDGFLKSIRRLTEKNDTTVIMVTHKPEDLKYVHKVIFMGTKGFHSYYGNPSEILPHYEVDDIIEVYAKVGGASKEKQAEAERWYKKWYNEGNVQKEAPKDAISETSQNLKDSNAMRQYWWLTMRYLNVKLSDKLNTGIMIAQAPIIAILMVLIFKNIILAVPFMMAISAIWFGSNNAAREIVGELPIFKRERMFNLRIIPYILSKLTVLTLFSAIQALLFVLIVTAVYTGNDYVEWNNPGMSFVWMLVVSFVSTLMGLLLSASVDTTEKVMTLIPIVLIPQIMLAGIMAKIEDPPIEYVSYATISRWGTEGFCNIQDSICFDTVYVDVPELPPDNTPPPTNETTDGNMSTSSLMQSNDDDTDNAGTDDNTDEENDDGENTDEENTDEDDESTDEEDDSSDEANCDEVDEDDENEDRPKYTVGDAINYNGQAGRGLKYSFHDDYRTCQIPIIPEKWATKLKLDFIALAILGVLFFILTFLGLKKKKSV